MERRDYDAIIIGSGQGGMPLAFHLAANGKRVMLAERQNVGGSCINFGCTPTKTMVASARVAYHCSRASDYGVRVSKPIVDMSIVRKRKNDVVESFRSSGRTAFENEENIDLLDGHARFTGNHEVEVELASGTTVTARSDLIYIDTGTRPRIPNIPGLDAAGCLTNTTIMDLGEVPKRLAVIGGGYIGAEFAQMFRRFGAEVDIIHRGGHLLSREDDDVADAVSDIFAEDGISLHFRANPVEVKTGSDGAKSLVVETPDGTRTVTATHILVAAGRIPNTDDLGLENTDIETTEMGHIRTDEFLKTTAEGVYAIGDVKGGPAFTHISYDDFRIISKNLENPASASKRDQMVPYTVFIDPELGRVGLSEKEAKQRNISYRVAKLPLSSVARAIEMDETRGLLKALVGDEGEIIGMAALAPFGGELMSAVQIAMMGGLEYTDLRDGVFTHPTLTESLNSLFASM